MFREFPEAIQPGYASEVGAFEDFFVVLQEPGPGRGPDLPAPKLSWALRDLVSAYADMQDEVKAAWDSVVAAREEGSDDSPDSPGNPAHVLKQLLLPVMLRVMEDNGYPADEGGLQCFQNAVLRRVAEGDSQIKNLANKAMTLMGCPLVKQVATQMSTEDLMVTLGDENDVGNQLNALEFLCTCELDEYDLKKLYDELRRLHAELRPLQEVSLGMVATWAAWELLGVPRPCRSRLRAPPPVARLHRPSVRVVFEHVMRNQPLVITGALDERNFPPLRNFADFDYLRDRIGHRRVKMKADSSLDSEGRKLFMNDPSVAIPVPEFLSRIEENEQRGSQIGYYMGKVSLAEQLPELVEDIEQSPSSPWKKYGGCFGDLEHPIHTYFGCGRNTTSLHADPSENILLVVTGKKTFELYPPHDVDCLYTTFGKPLNSGLPPFTRPDSMAQKVAQKFPLYRNASPMRVDLEAGDMLYLPICWWHGVTGGAERNMILTWWSYQHPSKKDVGPQDEGARLLYHQISTLTSSLESKLLEQTQ